VQKEYENQEERADDIEEYWNIFNAQPDDNLQYIGNSSTYVPVVRDCVKARAKRTLKQLFPVNHKHVDGISSDGQTPYTQLSLLEHYIRKLKLKSICRSDLIAGDVTGQWGLYVDWTKSYRRVTELVRRNPIIEQIDGENVEDLELEDTLNEEESTEERDVCEEGPEVVDFATEDLAVIPPTCMDLQRAKAVSMRLRMSEEKVLEMVDEGVFILPDNTEIKEFCKPDQAREKKSPVKKAVKDAGVCTEGTTKYALIYEVHCKLDLGGESKEAAIVYFGGENLIVGIIKNPLWSGKRPIISEPVERRSGSFFGKSLIEPVKFMQWNLVDAWNMGQDSAMYTLLPIYKVDPLTTPQWAQLTAGLGAIWPVAPDNVDIIKMQQLWKDSMQQCEAIKRQIWESLDVNEMMMGKMPQGRKNNQLMGAMQQESAISISDNGERYEEVMLNPLCEMLFEFDQQFRTTSVEIESRGEIGAKAAIESIPVQQWGERYFFRWSGTAFMQSMQRMQQMIGAMNVVKGVPPQMLNGRRFDATPILEILIENVFGPEVAPRIFVDTRNMFTVDPDTENEILHNGMDVMVHEADEDPQHLQAHMKGAALAGDPAGKFKAHMAMHMQALQKKREMAMAQQQQMQKGAPGGPGAGQPGAAGAPRPGAMPAPGGARPAQNPAGAINADAMPGMPGGG
jgi:hypothetical protein